MQMLDSTLLALSDPTRRAILARLALGEATANELLAPFPISQPAISHHLKVLEQAGLILRRREGARRPCRLSPSGLAPLDGWLGELKATMEKNYQRLDAILAESTDTSEKA
jgi:DNA-binding transcriptional ArsR family regulator